MKIGAFKIANKYAMCRCEVEEGICEYYQINKESENYYKTEEPQEKLEWSETIGRKFKGGIVKIICSLVEEAEPTTELDEDLENVSQLVTPL